jgi:hypothetical protein
MSVVIDVVETECLTFPYFHPDYADAPTQTDFNGIHFAPSGEHVKFSAMLENKDIDGSRHTAFGSYQYLFKSFDFKRSLKDFLKNRSLQHKVYFVISFFFVSFFS